MPRPTDFQFEQAAKIIGVSKEAMIEAFDKNSLAKRPSLDFWPVLCCRCQTIIGVTNGNGGLPLIWCMPCERPALKEADEFVDEMEKLTKASADQN